MKTFIFILFNIVMIILLGCNEVSDPNPDRKNILYDNLQTSLDYDLNLYNGKGASAAILFPDGHIWQGVSGISHDNVLIKPDMIFGLGSVGKMFTATIVIQLVDEGLISLDDSLYEFLPPFPYIDSTIIIRQLLNHRSGIHNFVDGSGWESYILQDFSHFWTPEETIYTLLGEPYYEPGVRYAYSNTNYLLLGMIIENVTNSEAHTQFRQRIFEPLGLSYTFFPIGEDINGILAHSWGDIDQDGTIEDLSSYPRIAYNSMMFTSGGIYSTASDACKFSKALFNGELTSQESLNEMLDLIPVEYNPNLAMGLGISIVPDFVDGVTGLGYDGATFDYNARLVYVQEYNFHICVLLNKVDYECKSKISRDLANLVIDYLENN